MKNAVQIFLLIISFSVHFSCFADVPQLINYRGHLSGEKYEGKSLTVEIEFRLYDDVDTGILIWSETQEVNIFEGNFAVLLGSVNPITPDLFSENNRYLGLSIDQGDELKPRQQILSVPYSFQSQSSFESNPFYHIPSEIFSRQFSYNSYNMNNMINDKGVYLYTELQFEQFTSHIEVFFIFNEGKHKLHFTLELDTETTIRFDGQRLTVQNFSYENEKYNLFRIQIQIRNGIVTYIWRVGGSTKNDSFRKLTKDINPILETIEDLDMSTVYIQISNSTPVHVFKFMESSYDYIGELYIQ